MKEVKEEAIAEFKTRNGRTVFDGRGVLPYVAVMDPELAKVVGGLFQEDIFFDFATGYRASHADIGPAADFKLTEEIYQSFIDFAKSKEFDYDTESMAALDTLIARTKEERYYEHAQAQIEALRKELAPDRAEARAQLRLSDSATAVALLPGSRRGELEAHADLFIDTARRIGIEPFKAAVHGPRRVQRSVAHG